MTTTTGASVTTGTTSRYRGFAASLLLSSLLAGAAVALGGASVTLRVAAGILTAAAWLAGWGVMTGRHARRFPYVVLLAAVVLVLFVPRMWESSPWSPRTLHVAASLSYGAVAAAAALTALRLVGGGQALLLTSSTAVALFATDVLLDGPDYPRAPEWHLTAFDDPRVTLRYAPNSTGTMVYPDNPRGYFEETNPLPRDTWSLVVLSNSEAHLEHLPSEEGAMRVTIARRVGEPWTVSLQQAGFQIEAGNSYILRFRARADASRSMSCAVGPNHAPWGFLGKDAEVDVQPEWKGFECPFVATDSDADARIFFNLAASDAAVELSDVVLHNRSTGRDETPALPPKRVFVSYRFNSLGFRGPDPVVPRPAGTYRILALGDSYTAGVGVHEQDTFEVQLQNRLNRAERERGGTTAFDVINGGVTGYATREELRSYELFSSTYDPQVVLLVMVNNDEMSAREEARRGRRLTSRSGGGLTNLWNVSRLLLRQHDYTDSMLALKELVGATRQRGARLAVVIFTNSRIARTWATLDAAVREALEGTSVPILNLEEALLGGGRDENELRVHYTMDWHPNEIAHRIAAEEMERFLQAEHLLP